MHNSETFYEWAFEDVCMGVGGLSQEAEFCLSHFFVCVWHLLKSQPLIAQPSFFSIPIVKHYQGSPS